MINKLTLIHAWMHSAAACPDPCLVVTGEVS